MAARANEFYYDEVLVTRAAERRSSTLADALKTASLDRLAVQRAP